MMLIRHSILRILCLLLATLAALTAVPTLGASPPQQARDARDLWIDLRLGPPLLEPFNAVVRQDDISRVDSPNQIGQLRAIENGRKMVIFKSLAEAQSALPEIAEEIDVIGYNLENTPGSPVDERTDPLASVQAMRAQADEYGLQLAFGPDHDLALEHGVDIAPYVDIFVLQIQRQQTRPEVVAEFVEPLVPQLREANPDLEVSVQVRTEGDVNELVALVEGLDADLNGISILTSPETVDVAQDLLQALRPRAGFLPPMGRNQTIILLLVVVALALAGFYWYRRGGFGR